MQEITLVLTVEEINGILAVLGEMPTKTGAWNLLIKVQQQTEQQVKKEAE